MVVLGLDVIEIGQVLLIFLILKAELDKVLDLELEGGRYRNLVEL